MVIRGRTRGNGGQLANYLLSIGENEDIRILDVNGHPTPNDRHLHEALFSMSLTSELTKSDKGLYHAQINPAYGDDNRMSADSWLQATDLLGQELGLEEQRRVIVLHTKKGRTHAHVVWERYDMEKGRMISDSFSRLAQDRARKEMERIFEHKQTPHRNVKRPEMKEALSALWQKTKTGYEFLKEAGKAGYIIAKGVQRRPFMVVDETGRSFDLIRQLTGIKTKEVREKLKAEKLLPEKEAITAAKTRTNARSFDKVQEQAIDKIESFQEQAKTKEEAKKSALVNNFAESRETVTKKDEETLAKERQKKAFAEFTSSIGDVTGVPKLKEKLINSPADKKQALAQEFAESRHDAVTPEMIKEHKRQEMLQKLKEQQKRDEKNKDQGYEYI